MMLVDGSNARGEAGNAWVRQALLELAVPAAAVLALALALPHVHGVDRLPVAIAMLAVTAHLAVGLFRSRRAVLQNARIGAAISSGTAAVDLAMRATRQTLEGLQHDVLPSLNRALAAAEDMASDRRLTASVRGRAKVVVSHGLSARAVLSEMVSPTDSRPAPTPVAKAEPVDVPEVVYIADRDAVPGQLRVLVGEHNGAHQLVLRAILAQAGVEVVIVGDGKDVVEAWQREDWDVILLDVDLPGQDGLAVAQAIRAFEQRAGWTLTPLVGMAANASSKDEARYLDSGLTGWVAKPIEAQSLIAAIEAAMAEPAASDDWLFADVA